VGSSDGCGIDAVVFGVRSEKADVDAMERAVLHGDDEAVFVSTDVEDDPVVRDEVGRTITGSDFSGASPRGVLDLLMPRAEWLLRVGILRPEGDQGCSVEDAHGTLVATERSCSQDGSKWSQSGSSRKMPHVHRHELQDAALDAELQNVVNQ